MKFYTVCTLPHYHPHHVYRLLQQLQIFYDGPVEMFVYTDRPSEFDSRVVALPIQHNKSVRQWYKIDFFGLDLIPPGEQIIVMDLDWTILDDITDIVDMPVLPSQFAAVDRWWRSNENAIAINGGMYKFTTGTCSDMFNLYHTDPHYWQNVYRGDSVVGGEQDFVFIHSQKTHKLMTFPGHTMGRLRPDNYWGNLYIKQRYVDRFNMPYIDSRGQYNSHIKMVHGLF